MSGRHHDELAALFSRVGERPEIRSSKALMIVVDAVTWEVHSARILLNNHLPIGPVR